MPKYSTSISINADQESVWKRLSDVAHWHEWTPTVTKVEVLDTPELKLNNRYKVYQPKLPPAVWTVTILTPPSNFIWESRMPGMHMIAEHIVHAVTATQTEVTLSFAYQGFLGEIMGRLYRQMVESYIATEAQSLKKRVENS
jgi:carbon monoxide dehydrogenase subunit G